MKGGATVADGDRPIVLVPLATARRAARRAGVTLNLSAEDIALAGKWKHGWIPLDAVASAVKAKRYHGGATHELKTHSGPVHVRNVRDDANNKNMAIATVVKDHRKGTASSHAPGERVWVAKAQMHPLGPPSKGRAGSAVESRREPSRGRTKSAAVGARGRMTAHESVLAERNSFGKHRGSYDLGVSDAHHFQARHDLVKEKLGPDAHRAYSAGHARVGAVDHVRSGRAAKPAGKVKGELSTQGKTFSDAGDTTVSRRGHGLPPGGRKAAKTNPVGAPLEHPEPKYVTHGAAEMERRRGPGGVARLADPKAYDKGKAGGNDLAEMAKLRTDAELRRLADRSPGTAEGRAAKAELRRRARRAK